jgi:hypothetical protein
MAQQKKNQEVAETQDASLPTELMGDMAQDAGQGFENTDADSYSIPFLQALQALSPQVDESDGAYVDGAKQGMIINTVSNELFTHEDGVVVLPVHFDRSFIEWVPRNQGGGFVAAHSVEDGKELATSGEREGGAVKLPNGNQLVDTRQHYVLIIREDGSTEPAMISMSSTQIRKSRDWMTQMRNLKAKAPDGTLFTPPTFAYKYRLTTVKESNDQGSWWGWSIKPEGWVDDASLYHQAKSLKDDIMRGAAKAAEPPEAEGADTAEAGADF